MPAIINEAMDAGACGWSLQHLGGTSIQPDWDGTPMATDIMDEENILTLAAFSRDRNEGFIQMTYVPDNPGAIESEAQNSHRAFL